MPKPTLPGRMPEEDHGVAQRAGVAILFLILAIMAYAGLTLWRQMPTPTLLSELADLNGSGSGNKPPDVLAGLPQALPVLPPPPQRPAILAPLPQTQTKLPQFDIVRLETSGMMLVAGRAKPEADILLLNEENGGQGQTLQDNVLASAKADAAGFFLIEFVNLKPGTYAFSLRMKTKAGEMQNSSQNIAVFLPPPGHGEAMITLVEPDKPMQVLHGPAQVSGTSSQRLAFKTTEIEAGKGVFVTGQAAPSTALRLYLNDTLLAPVQAAGDGTWSLRIRQGLEAGSYRLRADAMGKGDSVTERAEISLDVPANNAPDEALDEQNAPSATVNAAVIEKIETARVEPGDSLWRISMKRLGSGYRYMQIYSANSAQIRDPGKIYPGQILVLPQASPQTLPQAGEKPGQPR